VVTTAQKINYKAANVLV